MYDASNVITETSRISYCCIIGLYIDYVDWYKREITIVISFIDHNYSIVTLIASKKISLSKYTLKFMSALARFKSFYNELNEAIFCFF